MATQIQLRGAATATQAARTLSSREADIDTTEGRFNIHNGSTAGGIPHANYKDVQNQKWRYAAASGTNTITITLDKAPASYAAGQKFKFKAANTNTGSATLNVNSLGAKTIKKVSGTTITTLDANDIVQNAIYEVTYDGTDFLLAASGAGRMVTAGDIIVAHSPGLDKTYKISSTTTYRRILRAYITHTGTVRVKHDLAEVSAGSGNANSQIYKNGVAFGAVNTVASNTFVTQSEDLAVTAGDYLDLYIRQSSAGADVWARNFQIRTAEGVGCGAIIVDETYIIP